MQHAPKFFDIWVLAHNFTDGRIPFWLAEKLNDLGNEHKPLQVEHFGLIELRSIVFGLSNSAMALPMFLKIKHYRNYTQTSMGYARQIDLGFKPDRVLAASFNLRLQGYNEAKGREFYQRIVERLERLPGVQTASVTNLLPLGFIWLSAPVVPEDREVPANERVFAGSQ